MSLSKLEKFIKAYVNNKKLSETEEGYSAWLRKNGVSGKVALNESISKATSEHKRATHPTSSAAEALLENGLSKSGYAEYLSDLSLEKQNKGIEDGIRGYLEDNAKNASLFKKDKAIAEEKTARDEAARLENEEKAKKKLYDSAKRGLEKAGTIDYDEAYAYAIEMGVDEENAKKLASVTTKVARENAIYRVTRAIVEKRMTMNQARLYALSLGLSDEDAEKLAEVAFKTNESVGDITAFEDYLDYLRDKSNKTN